MHGLIVDIKAHAKTLMTDRATANQKIGEISASQEKTEKRNDELKAALLKAQKQIDKVSFEMTLLRDVHETEFKSIRDGGEAIFREMNMKAHFDDADSRYFKHAWRSIFGQVKPQ